MKLWDLGHNLLLGLNACAFVGFLGMIAVLTEYLARELYYFGTSRYRFQGALSLYSLAIGGAISFGERWWMRYVGTLPPVEDTPAQRIMLIGGGALLVTGLLCWMRVWTPTEWRPWPVLITAVAMPALALGGPVAVVLVTSLLLVYWSVARRT